MWLYRRVAMATATALLLLLVMLPAVGSANVSPSRAETGACTVGAAGAQLEVLNENGQHRLSFRMERAYPGSEWAVVLKHNGVRFWHVHKFARADGGWTVLRLTTNLTGPDTFYAKATNTLNGQVCRAVVQH